MRDERNFIAHQVTDMPLDVSENVQDLKRKLMYLCKKSLRKH